jgi:translation initiation factor 3 subunit H
LEVFCGCGVAGLALFPPHGTVPTQAQSTLAEAQPATMVWGAANPVGKPTEAETPLRSVQIDGQVVMKIVKHCTEHAPTLVTGQLLGLDIGATLEVTDCFPFPNQDANATAAEGEEDDGANYQLEMMRCLREINVDNNTVGWYQSTYLGSYYTEELIETFLAYQENIKRCVCVVYDPTKSASVGTFGLKALRLTDRFLEIHRAGEFTFDKIADKSLSWADIVCEVPIRVANSALLSAMFGELTRVQAGEEKSGMTQSDVDRLSVSSAPFLEKSLEFLSECMDDLASEQQKVAHYQRFLSKQQAQQAQWLTKRKAENAQRRAQGLEPLPEEEDKENPAKKPLSEPSRLEGFLIANQVNEYCEQIQASASASLKKLTLVAGSQGARDAVPAV